MVACIVGLSLCSIVSCRSKKSDGQSEVKASDPETSQVVIDERYDPHVVQTMLDEYHRLESGSEKDQQRAELLKPKLLAAKQKLQNQANHDEVTKQLVQALDVID